MQAFIRILAPFAPFMAEELWQISQGRSNTTTTSLDSPPTLAVTDSVHMQTWPAWDPELVIADQVTIPVQINGKVRDQLVITPEEAQDKALVLARAKALDKVQNWLAQGELKKEIYVPGKILNLVVQK